MIKFVLALLFSCGCAVSTESESVGEGDEGLTTDEPSAVAPEEPEPYGAEGGDAELIHMTSCAFPSALDGSCYCPGWVACGTGCCKR